MDNTTIIGLGLIAIFALSYFYERNRTEDELERSKFNITRTQQKEQRRKARIETRNIPKGSTEDVISFRLMSTMDHDEFKKLRNDPKAWSRAVSEYRQKEVTARQKDSLTVIIIVAAIIATIVIISLNHKH